MFQISANPILNLAIWGGIFSLLSTSLGAISILFRKYLNTGFLSQTRLSLDFALGIMLSAVAFSLFGPELLQSIQQQNFPQLRIVLIGFFLGLIFIAGTQQLIQKWSEKRELQFNSTHLVLSMALILHNFPEGMGAGASLAGMNLQQALPIQIAIAIQNFPEGLILAACFLSFGWKLRNAILGSVFSGVIEFLGALLAGFALQKSLALLPVLLSVAGGAMLMSVFLEIYDSIKQGRFIRKGQLIAGLLTIPFLNLLLNL